MANANLLAQMSGLGNAQGVGVLSNARAQGENIAASQQQRQQSAQNQNYLNQQRSQQQEDQQREEQMAPLRNDYVNFRNLPDDAARDAAWKGGLAQHYGQDPNSPWQPAIANLLQTPGFVPPQIVNTEMERLLAPKPVNYGNPVPGVTDGKPVYQRFPKSGGGPGVPVKDFAPPPKEKNAGGAGAATAANTYGPDEIRTAAMVVASDPAMMKQYASFGQSGQNARVAINKGITELKQETGMSDADFIRARTSAQAERGSIQKMTAQQNGVAAFENLAKANGQRLLDLFSQVDDTGVPVIEGLTRAAKRAGGNVDAAELKSVLVAFQAETSRILGNPNMTGVVSDTARKEVEQMANGNMSVGQAKRVINRIFTEFDLRNQFLGEQIAKAGAGVVVGGTPTPAPTAPVAAPQAAPAPIADGWTVTPHQ